MSRSRARQGILVPCLVALAALLVLVEAGMIVGDTSISSPAKSANMAAPTPIKTRLPLAG